MWIPVFTSEVPDTITALIQSLGGWVAFPLLCIPLLLAWWGLVMKRRSRSLALALLPASLLPLLYGVTTSFILVFEGFHSLGSNPVAGSADLGLILYRSLFPLFLGGFISFFAIPPTCLAIARSREPVPQSDPPEAGGISPASAPSFG